jgi:cytochrome b6-f complex iron-sulfur subunit
MSTAAHAPIGTVDLGRPIPRRARPAPARKLARRSFLRVSVFAGLTLTTGALVAGTLGFVNARKPAGFGGTVVVPTSAVPLPGDEPKRLSQGKFWLVNLDHNQGDVFGVGGTGGLIALYWKCPHLGCTVPWRADFDGGAVSFPGIVGWFRCPCHGSTYSRAGVRVYGPAPRSLDVMQFAARSDGSVEVNTGTILKGSLQNPLRAVTYSG